MASDFLQSFGDSHIGHLLFEKTIYSLWWNTGKKRQKKKQKQKSESVITFSVFLVLKIINCINLYFICSKESW